MKAYISGHDWSEQLAVLSLLQEASITTEPYHIGCGIGPGDVLVLCLSTAPLLGWGRYLRLIRFMARRYDCHVIVLHPELVPLKTINTHCRVQGICGDLAVGMIRMLLLSGVSWMRNGHAPSWNKGCFGYSQVKQAAKFAEDITHLRKSKGLTDISCFNNIYWRARVSNASLKTLYSRRAFMIYRLGFKKAHHLRVFFAGDGLMG